MNETLFTHRTIRTRPHFGGRRWGQLCAAICCLVSTVTFAQTWEVFDNVTAAFPSNNMSDIVEDADGIIWAGTGFGLCRYDGSTWSVWQSDNSGLPGNSVKCLGVDSTNRLWVGTLLNGIGIYDGSSWDYLNTDNSPLPDNEINCITFDHRGWVWIGTYLGVVCYTGTDWRLYNSSDTSYGGLMMHGNVIEDIGVREDGLVAICTQNGGFHYLTDTSIVFLTTFDDQFPDNTQNSVAFDTVNDERWLATPSQGLLRQGGGWENGPWFQYTTSNSTIPSNSVTCVVVDDQSRVWLGTLIAGIGVRDPNGSFISYNSINSELPNNTIESILLASDGSVWVATGFGGVARLTFQGAIKEFAQADFELFPNPCAGRVNIRFKEDRADWSWSISDSQGRSLRNGRASHGDQQLEVTGLSAGMYVVNVNVGYGPMTRKFQILQ